MFNRIRRRYRATLYALHRLYMFVVIFSSILLFAYLVHALLQ